MKRDKKILTHLEAPVYQAVHKIIESEKNNGVFLSDSAYVRKAVLKDLVDKGLLTPEMVLELAG